MKGRYELEEVKEGVWIHTETPDGVTFSVFVNVCGSDDGVTVELWKESRILEQFYVTMEDARLLGWDD
ncbi:MAG: hypothetical protein VXX23_00975 [Actinomycetota bacterium]|nr:hypothetical protein [Actinomycetota bacterium]